jgi:hypothetical protein
VLTGVGAAYVWPLLGSLTTAIPGGPTDHDVATMVWNVGYVFRALTSDARLLMTADVLVPLGADLRLHTYGLLQGLAAAPVVPLLGVPGAFNLMLVGTLVLNGLAGYALMRREGGNDTAALVAATCLMLMSPLLDQLRVGRPTFASLWIVACTLIVAGSLVDAPRLWKGLLLGLVLVAALLTDFQIVFFCGVWLAIYGIARFRLPHAAALAVGALVFLIPFGVLFYPALAGAAVAGYPQPVPADMREYSFRIWDYVDPAVVPHAYGFELGAAAVVGAILLWRCRRLWLWLIGALMCLVLALGPFLQPTDLPLPFAFLSTWPPLAQFRTPYRMAMPAALGLAVVLALVLTHLFARLPSRPAGIAAGVLILARLALAVVHDPLRVQVYPEYAIHARLASDPRPFTLLEVPVGVRSGIERIGNGGEVLSYYQHVHGKPLVSGMIARVPSTVFETYRASPALLYLSGDTLVAPTDADMAQLVRWVNAGYVLLHRDMLSSDQAQAIEALLDRQPFLQREAVGDELVGYSVKLAPPVGPDRPTAATPRTRRLP